MSCDVKDKKIIVTIGREYGSGGRQIGKKISSMLGIPFYDKELLNRAAQESGIDQDVFDNMDEKRVTSLLFSIVRGIEKRGSSPRKPDAGILTMNERLYLIQKQVLKNIAMEGSCVIMGRCSDVILKNDPNAVHFFIKAPMDYKIYLLKEIEGLEPKAAEKMIKEIDKERMGYHKYYTGEKWGQSENYNYIMDSSLLGVEGTARIMCEIIETIAKNKK